MIAKIMVRGAAVVLLAMLCSAVFALEPAKAAERTRLDFSVQKVWVGTGCKVEVRVVRSGAGMLPSKKFARVTLLRIKIGKKSFDYDFKTVDPSARLLQGPGAITFRSPLVVRKPTAITVIVDPQGRIKETAEGRANLVVVKAEPSKCGGNSRDRAVMRSLKIVHAYNSNGTLFVVLDRKPGAGVPREAYQKVALRVQSGAVREEWPLLKAFRVGKRGKGGLHFNTKMKVMPGTRVKVALKKGKFTKRRVFTLAAAPKPKSGGRRKGGGVPKGESHGIMVFKPTSSKVAHRGGHISVLYGVGRDVPGGPIRLTLMRGPQEFNYIEGIYRPATGSRPNEHQVEFPIPGNVAYGPGYYIKASMPGGQWGNSDEFKIEPLVDSSSAGRRTFEIRVVAPSGSATSWQQGTTQMLSWRLLGDYHGTPSFLVSLWKGGRKVLDIDASSAVWHANSRTYTMNWQVPSDLAYGSDYRLKVADRHSSGEDVSDEYFNIVGPIKVFIAPEYFLSDPMTIRWEILPSADIGSVRILLITTAGDPHYTIWPSYRAYNGSCVWPVGANLRGGDGFSYDPDYGELLRGPFKIRVQKVSDSSVYGDSQEFMVKDPRMTVTTSSIRRGRRINWSSTDLDPNARVNVRVSYYNRTTMRHSSFLIARDKPVNGSMDWEFGDTYHPGYYPSDSLLPAQARIVVTVQGFWLAGVGGQSAQFTLEED